MNSRLLLHELTRTEISTIAARALLILPTGAVEQHGPHLPVGTDYFVVEHVAQAAAAEVATQIPVVVAPAMPFGSSHHHLPFGGTMSINTDLYYRVIYDLAESLVGAGFRRLFILNGHGGNDELVQLVARDLVLNHPVDVAAASYWTVAWDALVAQGATAAGELPGHAGTFETSLIMALRPGLAAPALPHREVTVEAAPPRSQVPFRAARHGFWQRIDGYTDSPDQADSDRGGAYLAAIVRAVAAAFVAFYAATDGVAGT